MIVDTQNFWVCFSTGERNIRYLDCVCNVGASGELIFLGANGKLVAVHAPGTWRSVWTD